MEKKQYKLYQVKEEDRREYGFLGLREKEMLFGTNLVDKEKYEVTYTGEVEYDAENPMVALEDLYRTFNIEHPEDFKSYSMSVGDMIEIDGHYWYCDSFGFKDVTGSIMVSIEVID